MINEGNQYKAGVKMIFIKGQPTKVYCDDEGYTVIQSRGQFGNPIDYFYRGWQDYLKPFGTAGEEHWLGLKNIFYLTNQKSYSLKIEAVDQDGNQDQATWDFFRLTEDETFTLQIGGYNGGLGGDSLTVHNGYKFSTKDRDNDDVKETSCAQSYTGAWWYKSCHASNLNGKNFDSDNTPYAKGIVYWAWKGFYHSLESVKMSIRD